MEKRWDCMRVVCIKEYKTIKVGYHYSIKGRVDLSFNADPEVEGRTGYGFCVEEPHNEKIKWYYFTEEEMSEYFITEYEHYKTYLRNEKIKQILS